MSASNEWDVEDDGPESRRRRGKPPRPLVSPALVARVQNGSLAAFRELVVHFQDDVFAHALALTGDLDAACAAARDVFVRAHGEVRALTDANQVPVMLRRLVQRNAPPVDELRATCGPTDAATGALENREASYESSSPTDAVLSASAEAEEAGFLARILELSFEERAVALLALAADATVAEIAALIGIPAATVSNRLAIAEKRVKHRAWRGVQELLARARPSASSAFADEVLALVEPARDG